MSNAELIAYRRGREAARRGTSSPYIGWNLPQLEAAFDRGYRDYRKELTSA